MSEYRRLLEIASGGHGSVVVAEASGGRLCVLKTPHAHLLADRDGRATLEREAKIALGLSHPNVIRVEDLIASDDGTPSLVLEYVEGATLSDLIRSWLAERREDTAAVALCVVRDACQGIAALHGLAGIVAHRDVSPQNIMVGSDGVARILDFGIAKCFGDDRATTTGILKGKVGYLAPEYVAGEAYDGRVDVFALGVVLWEALAKQRLFRGENDAHSLELLRSRVVPPLAKVAPELGAAAPALDRVIARALGDVGERFATPLELANAIDEVAREHGLRASASDVRAAFGPELAKSLAERRLAIEDERERAQRQRQDAERLERRSAGRRVLWVVMGIALLVVAVSATLLLSRKKPASEATAVPAPAPSATSAPIASQLPLPSVTVVASAPLPAPRPTARHAPSVVKKPRPNPY